MKKLILQQIHAHERDEHIKFYQHGHKYEIDIDPNTKYTSVTTWVHSHFPKFDADDIISKMMNGKNWGPTHKYWNMTPKQIKDSWNSNGNSVSNAGTQLHENIELFMNSDTGFHKDLLNNYVQTTTDEQREGMCDEWKYFIKFISDFPDLKPYRTEWMIFDEDLKLAGSIDMVYENSDGTLMIYDWKRCKDIVSTNTWNRFSINPLIGHIPDTNYWHYALQLNTYKSILERKYQKTVTKLCLVRLHPNNVEQSYELLEVPILSNEIEKLFEKQLKDKTE